MPKHVKLRNQLNDKQMRFVLEYLKDLNGTQAIIRAGYSPIAANVKASALLSRPHVAAEIQKRLARKEASAIASADEVLTSLTLIGRSKNGDFLRRDSAGNVIPELDLDRMAAHPTGEIAFGQIGRNPDRTPIMGIKKFKAPNVLEALTLLGKHHKLFSDKIEHDFSDDLVARLNRGRQRLGEAPVDLKVED